MSFFGPDLGGDRLQDRLDQRPGLFAAAGHQARPFERPFLAAGDARADEQQPLALDVLRPPLGVRVVLVAAVDQHVARRQVRQQLLDQVIHRLPGLDHHHDLARRFDRLAPALRASGSR